MKALKWKHLTMLAALLPAAAPAQEGILVGEELIRGLREGGYVLLMRDPQSEQTLPQAPALDPAPGRDLERLVEEGREQARLVGQAFNTYDIPIGEVLVSPDQRALEAARLAGLEDFRTESHLDEELGAADASAQWLRDQAGKLPEEGRNDLYITHHTVILRAFPELAPRPENGEIIVIDPDGGANQEPAVVSRVRPHEWERLAG